MLRLRTRTLSREAFLLILIVALVMVISMRNRDFASISNITAILVDTAILAIIAIAQFGAMASGGIDLSVASNMALSSLLVASLHVSNPAVPISLLVILAIAIGAGLGAFNGILVAFMGLPAVIATLGTLSIYQGLAFLYTGGYWINAHELTTSFKRMTRVEFLAVPSMIWFLIGVSLVAYLFYGHTKPGREFYGVGGNSEAALLGGVSLVRVRFMSFLISGALAGLAGILYVSRYAMARSDTALGLELQTVAACVIGGVSVSGGVGSVGGAVLGALFLGLVYNALPVINVSPFYQMALQGAVIVGAVSYNGLAEARSDRIARRKRGYDAVER